MHIQSSVLLRKFDAAVTAAYAAPAAPSALRGFLGTVRELIGAVSVNLVVYGRDESEAPFGVHEYEELADYVPEMQNVPGYELLAAIKAPNARSVMTLVAWPRFLQSEVYRRYYQRFGVLHHAYRELDVDGQRVKLVTTRCEGAADFTLAECELIDRVADHFERAHAIRRTSGPLALGRTDRSLSCVSRDPIAAAGSRFGLTPGELRLLRPLATGSGLRCAAIELDISINTAKSRLRAIFEKTDTHSQAQLVRLLLEPKPALLG